MSRNKICPQCYSPMKLKTHKPKEYVCIHCGGSLLIVASSTHEPKAILLEAED